MNDLSVDTFITLNVELRANAQGLVFYYAEEPRPAHERIVRATNGYALPFAESCWQGPPPELEPVPLAVGTRLEPTGRSVMVAACGPPTSVAEFRVGRHRLWVLRALYELIPNPAGGSSLGGITFVEQAAW